VEPEPLKPEPRRKRRPPERVPRDASETDLFAAFDDLPRQSAPVPGTPA